MKLPLAIVVAGLSGLTLAQSGLWVDIPSALAPMNLRPKTDDAVRRFGHVAAALTQAPREQLIAAGRYDRRFEFSLPTTVRVRVNGHPLTPTPRDPGDLVLVFDATGTGAFPADYRTLLQSVFDTAKPTLNVVFGMPAAGGNVLVKNFDATIGDRDAVAGGYYLPNNGSGQPEIRFPVYNSPEAAAVNFLHTLLLAYIGPNPYGFDSFQEGLVRAATMKVARTAGALPASLDSALIDLVLDNTYDVGSFYDWYNQRALGGKQFIAPNLRDVPLPTGGSLGGIYLLRYQMAGTTWQKLVTENTGYLAEFNRRFYLDPSAASDIAKLSAIGQAALDTVKGAANSKVEGLAFDPWMRRQFILETKDVLGPKLLVQPVPINSGLGGTDFGVFDVSATYFETAVGGNETLLSATAYPIFWDQAFNRVLPSAQEDQMPIAGAYGSVTPNLPDINGGQPYRCTVDIPVGDRVARAYLPAGSVATAANPDPNNFYGTLIGVNLTGGATAKVRVTVGTTIMGTAPVRNGAFGIKITNAQYTGYARLKVDIFQTVGSTDTLLATRFVNKGPGELALDLRIGGDGSFNLPGGLLKGIQMVGLPIDPWVSTASDLLGVPEAQALIARYDPTHVAYDLYPDTGAVQQGQGVFIRMNAAGAFSVAGRLHPKIPVAVALKPGWNQITCPLTEEVTTSRVLVIKGAEFPMSFAEARGIDIGTDFFEFQRGAIDQASGAPENGTMVAATKFVPGKAYYVRVLASQGVSLLFFPSNFSARIGHPFVATGWRLSAKISTQTSQAEAIIGQSVTGTRLFDRREDATLPPGIGGMQIAIEAADSLFKDVRRLNTGETYRLRIEGLVPNRSYTIRFAAVQGSPPSFTLVDSANQATRSLTPGSSYTFVARASTQRIEIKVFGGGQ